MASPPVFHFLLPQLPGGRSIILASFSFSARLWSSLSRRFPSMSKDIDIPQRPKGAVFLFVWWLRKLFFIGARARCPRCEQGPLFEKGFTMFKRCPNCSILYQPYPGDELGVIAVGYFLTLIPSLIGVVAAYAWTDWSPGFLLFFFMFLMTVILIGFYRSIKGIWIALVFLLTGLRRRL